MTRRTNLLVLAAATALAPLPVAAAPQPSGQVSQTSSTEQDSTAVRLQVETSAMADEAESTRAWVLRDGTKALTDVGVQVSPEADTEVRVIIAPKDLGYTVTIEVREGEAQAPSSTRGPKICETCTRTELVGLVGRELAWVGGWLAGSPAQDEGAEPAADVTPEEGAADEPGVDSGGSDPSPPPAKLHPLGWAGIGVGAVGLGMFVGGFVLLLRDYEAKGELGNYRIPRPNIRPVGWTMVGLGAAALVGGTVMLVFDLVKGRRSSVAAGPWLEPGAGGLWVRRRF